MELALINLWAVLGASVLTMIISSLWYSPLLFSKPWMEVLGITPEQIAECKEKGVNMTAPLIATFITSILTSYLLAALFLFVMPSNICQALVISLALWLGFVGVVHLDTVSWENRPWKYFFITTGCRLLNLLVIATVLYYWK
jgi:hypothetical protein